ncbi:ImuA family protein [Phaeobacter sp. HF9A]|uniref:ImuA family protein n=1 Tax=Phaeobacter sp. HF9A TaxID=2721561 RepID=UPI00142FE0BA|nr:hypothetical protein [Phaeobacter sp. HF9A]NIZ13802.1 hypothetical protein [Phaeobacter sp. HF9A]
MTRSALPFPLTPGRAHEACGSGATTFAFALAAQLNRDVLWVQEAWEPTQINPQGLADFIDPARLLMCNAANQTEVLAVSEEGLRSATVALVVSWLNKPLGLTEGRRLQLAARAGKSVSLALIPEGMGSNAAETRWRCTPAFDPNAAETAPLHHWELIKNKSGALGNWQVRWDKTTRRLTACT